MAEPRRCNFIRKSGVTCGKSMLSQRDRCREHKNTQSHVLCSHPGCTTYTRGKLGKCSPHARSEYSRRAYRKKKVKKALAPNTCDVSGCNSPPLTPKLSTLCGYHQRKGSRMGLADDAGAAAPNADGLGPAEE
jgi:hypothetical protein